MNLVKIKEVLDNKFYNDNTKNHEIIKIIAEDKLALFTMMQILNEERLAVTELLKDANSELNTAYEYIKDPKIIYSEAKTDELKATERKMNMVNRLATFFTKYKDKMPLLFNQKS